MRKENQTSYRRLFINFSYIYCSCFPLIPSVHKRCNQTLRLLDPQDRRPHTHIYILRVVGPETSRALCVINRYDGKKRLYIKQFNNICKSVAI